MYRVASRSPLTHLVFIEVRTMTSFLQIIYLTTCLYCGKLVNGDCSPGEIPHLVPAQMPSEMKEFISRVKSSDLFNFTQLVLELELRNSIQGNHHVVVHSVSGLVLM